MVPTAPTWTKPAPSLSGQSAPTFAPLSPVHTQQPEVLLKRQSDHTSPLLTVLQWFFMTLRAIAKVPSMPPTQDLGCHLSDLTTYLSPIAHPTLATLTTSCARTHCLSSPLASQFQMATLPFPPFFFPEFAVQDPVGPVSSCNLPKTILAENFLCIN